MYRLSDLLAMPKESLANMLYNDWIAEHANYGGDEPHERECGKRIPYIGWFWRSCDFVHKDVTIGDCGQFIGVMRNNKWDYPERSMTDEEVDRFVAFVDEAIVADNRGGVLSDIIANRNAVFDRLWDWMQTLKVEPRE